MTIDDSYSDQDRAALAFCIELLEREPDLDYKEARREARVSKGLSVRRQIWTTARRQCGVGPHDEVVSEDVLGHAPEPPSAPEVPSAPSRSGAPESAPWGRESGRRHHSEQAPERQPTSSDHHAGESAGTPTEPRWPGGRKPAWATPSHGAKDPDPKPASMFLNPARNPIEFMVQYLKTTNAEANFDEVREAAENAGFTAYPATFGRAQALAGLLDDENPEEPIRVSSAAPANTTTPAAVERPERKQEATGGESPDIDPVAGMQAFIAAMGKAERDQAALKKRIERMLEVIQHALED